MFDEIPVIKEGQVTISKNAVLVAYTDGVTEVENNEKEEFGSEGLERILAGTSNGSMKDLNDEIMKEIIEFKGDMPYIDDIALFACRFR